MVITRAAIMFSNGETIEGHDYGQISTLAHKLSYTGDKIYGFMTSGDDFILPEEAAEVAFKASQISEKVDKLTPAMLWPWLKED